MNIIVNNKKYFKKQDIYEAEMDINEIIGGSAVKISEIVLDEQKNILHINFYKKSGLLKKVLSRFGIGKDITTKSTMKIRHVLNIDLDDFYQKEEYGYFGRFTVKEDELVFTPYQYDSELLFFLIVNVSDIDVEVEAETT